MGGVRNLAHFATEATINFLSKRRVTMFFILDRDQRDEAEVQRLSAQLGDKAKLIVLKKREIENYLLSPRAIAEFIEWKHQLAGNKEYKIANISEVEQALDKCADALKNVAIERRVAKITCLPIYPNRNDVLNCGSGLPLLDRVRHEFSCQKARLDKLEQDLQALLKAQTELIENSWTTKKRDLVPGDLLLDEVCKMFGMRFNKERDSARLASLMRENEVDSEIRDILTSFAEPVPIN